MKTRQAAKRERTAVKETLPKKKKRTEASTSEPKKKKRDLRDYFNTVRKNDQALASQEKEQEHVDQPNQDDESYNSRRRENRTYSTLQPLENTTDVHDDGDTQALTGQEQTVFGLSVTIGNLDIKEEPSELATLLKMEEALAMKDFVNPTLSAKPEEVPTSLNENQIRVLIQKVRDNQEPDVFDPHYHCCACPRDFDRQITYYNHLISKHKIKIDERKYLMATYKGYTITDSRLFCYHCYLQYTSLEKFQHHLTVHHNAKKVLESRPYTSPYLRNKMKKEARNEDLVIEEMVTVPEPDHEEEEEESGDDQDDNNPATKTDAVYQNYIKRSKELTAEILARDECRMGRFQKEILKNRNIIPDVNDKNFYCKVCKVTFDIKTKYHNHLRNVHKMVFSFNKPVRKFKKSKKLPSVNDPNNYCSVCDIPLSTKLSYTYHLRNVHKMDIPYEKSPGIRVPIDKDSGLVDVNDIDYYCDYCKRGYSVRYSYEHHLRMMHFIDLPPRRPNAMKPHMFRNPHLEPDILDPNNFCRVCETKFKGKSSYRIHLVRFHGKKEELLTLKRGTGVHFYAKRHHVLKFAGLHTQKPEDEADSEEISSEEENEE